MTDAPSTAAYLVLADRQRARSQQLEPGVSDVFGCRKRFAYKLALTQHTDVSTSLPAIIGTAIHEAAEKAIRMFRGDEVKTEYEVIVLGLKGHVDRFENGIVDDLKTVAFSKFQSIKLHGADQKHWVQVALYGQGMVDLGFEVEKLRIEYFDRNFGNTVSFDSPLRPDLVELAEQWINMMRETPLEWAARDENPSSQTCQSCPFRTACWGTAYSRLRPDEYPMDLAPTAKTDADRLFDVIEQRKALEAEEKTLKAGLKVHMPEGGGTVDVGSIKWMLRWVPSGKGYRLDFVPRD